MKYIILILTFMITSVSYSQTKHPKKKSVKTHKVTVNTDSLIHKAALATIDSLKAKGYIKN